MRESPNAEKSNEMEMTREKKRDIKERQRRSTQVSGVPPGDKRTNGTEAMFTDSLRLPTYRLRR